MKADGMTNDKVEDTIRETKSHVTKATFFVRRSSEDVINKFTGDNCAFAHDVNEKLVVMGYWSTRLRIRKLGLFCRTDQPLHRSDNPIPTTMRILLYQGFII
ncbi:Uncharacterized protein TCM_027611 [Theobroma cacao]|uniref:Uncharacterized protein n=1 Tax=Theobroma cacao TaxID=3641 RepID=A0A061G9X6_THECC|nr:Uncharacterized protein TCM_027611 [Theobroma cacao]